MYSEKVMDHFNHPRNVGEIENVQIYSKYRARFSEAISTKIADEVVRNHGFRGPVCRRFPVFSGISAPSIQI